MALGVGTGSHISQAIVSILKLARPFLNIAK